MDPINCVIINLPRSKRGIW